MGAVKLIAVASAKGILEMEKNQRYIAASATDDLAICSLIDLVFKLLIPEFNIHGKMKITAKKDRKKIICDKLKSCERYFTKVFRRAKFNDAKSIHKADFILDDIFKIYFIIYNMDVRKKVYKNPEEALSGLLFDGMTIMSGGFGVCGLPRKSDTSFKR